MKPRFSLSRCVAPVALAAMTLVLMTSTGCAAEPAQAWSQVPAILARIVPPTFPDREFNIEKFGAVGDGTNDCTKAFAAAIAACHEADLMLEQSEYAAIEIYEGWRLIWRKTREQQAA